MYVLHRDDKGLVGTGLEEEFPSLVPIGIRKIDGNRLVGIDIKGTTGREDDVVVMAALADEQDLGRLQGRIVKGMKGIGGNTGGHWRLVRERIRLKVLLMQTRTIDSERLLICSLSFLF